MQSNAIFHFYCSLRLFVSGSLIVESVEHIVLFTCSAVTFTGFETHCHLQVNFRTAAYEIPKIMQNYDIVPFEI